LVLKLYPFLLIGDCGLLLLGLRQSCFLIL